MPFLLVLLLSSFFATAAAPQTRVTLVVANNYAPLMTEDGGISGDILEEVKARLDSRFAIDIEIMPWARGVTLVENGRAQGLVGTYYRPNIRPWINPYSEPLLQDPVSIFCREGVADPSWTYPEDYAGLRFGYLIGSYAAGEAFAAMREAGAITVNENRTIRGNLQMLLAGRIDCFVEGRYPIQFELASLSRSVEIEIVSDVKTEDFYVGFQSAWASSEAASEFIAEFNSIVRAMQVDGTIHRILMNGLRLPQGS